MKPRQDKTLWRAPKTKEKNLTAQGRRSGKDKTTVSGCPNGKTYRTANPTGYRGERVGDGVSPVFGDLSDFRTGQGCSAIP